MKKLEYTRCLTYFTIIIVIFIILQGTAFASKSSSDKPGDQKKNMQEESGSSIFDELNNTSDASIPDRTREGLSGNLDAENQNRISEYKQEKQKIRAELELQRGEYREARKDFQKVKSKIRNQEINPDSNEAINATKTYLNSSISYMIAHLSNVKNNIEYSNSNRAEKIINDLDEKIKLLEIEKAEVANTSSLKELAVTVRSVRNTWDDAQKTSLVGSGQIVGEKVGEFLNKSEALSVLLDKRIQDLNGTGADVSDLRIKLSSYKSYIKSAQDKKKDADTIYSNISATREDLGEANNYLIQSISDINKANNLLRDIFEELKMIRSKEV